MSHRAQSRSPGTRTAHRSVKLNIAQICSLIRRDPMTPAKVATDGIKEDIKKEVKREVKKEVKREVKKNVKSAVKKGIKKL